MKYEITYSCGHTEAVQIYGTNVHGEREKKAAWLAEHHVCSACLKADREAAKAAAAERAKANGMTEGSDKQMAWAADIIEDAARHTDTFLRALGIFLQQQHPAKVPALMALGKDEARARASAALEEKIAKAWTLPAKTIIDTRNSIADMIASGAANALAATL